MQTKLYISVSLNGQLLKQEERHVPPPAEVMRDFMKHVQDAGNIIMGKHSALALLGNPQALKFFSDVRLVVLSREMQAHDRCEVVRTPEEALQHLAAKGFKTAFIAGGARTYNSFVTLHMVDELIMNINPEITTSGAAWVSRNDFKLQFMLHEMTRLSSSISQLSFRRTKKSVL